MLSVYYLRTTAKDRENKITHVNCCGHVGVFLLVLFLGMPFKHADCTRNTILSIISIFPCRYDASYMLFLRPYDGCPLGESEGLTWLPQGPAQGLFVQVAGTQSGAKMMTGLRI